MSNSLRNQGNKLLAIGTTGATAGAFLLSACAPSETTPHPGQTLEPGTTLTAVPTPDAAESCRVILQNDGNFAAVAIFKATNRHASLAKVELSSAESIGVGDASNEDHTKSWDNTGANGQTIGSDGEYHATFTSALGDEADTLHISGNSAAPVACEATRE